MARYFHSTSLDGKLRKTCIRWLKYKPSSALFTLLMQPPSLFSHCFFSLGIFPSYSFSPNFPQKIFSTFFFFFLLILQLQHLRQACQLSVCTQEVWSFRPLALLLCRPNSLPRSPPVQFLHCVWTCILYSSGLLPWLSSSTHQHRLLDGHLWPESCGNLGVFIIQRPCSLCCFSKGGSKGVCFGRGRCRADTVSLTASKSHSRLPPHYLFQSRKAQARSHRNSAVCVFVCSWVCVLTWHLYYVCVFVCGIVMYTILFAWAGTHFVECKLKSGAHVYYTCIFK